MATEIKQPTKQTILILSIFIIGVMGLANSFDALTNLAIDSGFTQSIWLARTFAIMIDSFIIVLGGAWLWGNLNNEVVRWYVALMLIWTGISLLLNFLHAPPNGVARFISILPPITIFASFHVGWDIIKKITHHNITIVSIDQLKTEHDQLLKRVEQIKKEYNELPQQHEKLKAELMELKTERDQLKTERDQLLKRVEQLQEQYEQLETGKKNIKKFLNGLTASKNGKKQDRLKTLLPIISELAGSKEQYTKRDIETIKSKLNGQKEQD